MIIQRVNLVQIHSMVPTWIGNRGKMRTFFSSQGILTRLEKSGISLKILENEGILPKILENEDILAIFYFYLFFPFSF